MIIVSKLEFPGVLCDKRNRHIQTVTAHLTKFFKSKNIDNLFIAKSSGGLGV